MAETAFYIYELSRAGQNYIGYGITKDFDARNYQHNRTFQKQGIEVVRSFVKVCSSRALALELEKSLKIKFSGLGLDIEGFKTESLPKELFGEFREFVSSFDFGKEVPDIPKEGAARATHYRRLADLGLKSPDLLNKKTKAAFDLTFTEPSERFKVFNQLMDLRVVLAKYGLKSTKDLQVLLEELNKPEDSL